MCSAMTVLLLLIAAAAIFYVVRFVSHRKTGLTAAQAAQATVQEESRARHGFTRAEQNAEAERLQVEDPSLSNYAALRQARKNLSA